MTNDITPTTPASPIVVEFAFGCEALVQQNKILQEKIAALEEKNRKLRKSSKQSSTCGNRSERADIEDTSISPKIRADGIELTTFSSNNPFGLTAAHTRDLDLNYPRNNRIEGTKKSSRKSICIFLLIFAFPMFFCLGGIISSTSTVTDVKCRTEINNCTAITADIRRTDNCEIGDIDMTNFFTLFYNDCPLTADYFANSSTCYPYKYRSIKIRIQEFYDKAKAKELNQTRFLIAHRSGEPDGFFSRNCDLMDVRVFNFSASKMAAYNRNVFITLLVTGGRVLINYDHITKFCEKLKEIRPDASVHILFISPDKRYPYYMPRNNSLYSTVHLYSARRFNYEINSNDVVEAIEATWPMFANEILIAKPLIAMILNE